MFYINFFQFFFIIFRHDSEFKESTWMELTNHEMRTKISKTILENENKKELSAHLYFGSDFLLPPNDWKDLMSEKNDDDCLAIDLPFVKLTANSLKRNFILVPILQEDMKDEKSVENNQSNVENNKSNVEGQNQGKMFLTIYSNENEAIQKPPFTFLYFPEGQFGPDAHFQSININCIDNAVLNNRANYKPAIDTSEIQEKQDKSEDPVDDDDDDDYNDDFNRPQITTKGKKKGNAFNQTTMLTPQDPASTIILNETEKIQKMKLGRDKKAPMYEIAPGEGKRPEDWLREPTFDIDGFPHLFPDGKYGLHYKERTKKITPAKYFPQRVTNFDNQFAKDADYIFMAQQFMERYALEKQINMSMNHGSFTKTEGDQIKLVPSDDKVTIFQSIPGTPAYWQKFRNEVYARMQQLGPFHLFYTLSCAEGRWASVIAEVLRIREKGKIEICFPEENWDGNMESVTVKTSDEIEASVKLWWEKNQELYELPEVTEDVNLLVYYKWYLKQNIMSKTDFLKDHFILISRIFNNRVKAFHTEVMKKKGIKNYCYRVEFQMRGLPHIHGVAWLDQESTKDCLDDKGLFREDKDGEAFIITLIDKWTKCSLNPGGENEQNDKKKLNKKIKTLLMDHKSLIQKLNKNKEFEKNLQSQNQKLNEQLKTLTKNSKKRKLLVKELAKLKKQSKETTDERKSLNQKLKNIKKYEEQIQDIKAQKDLDKLVKEVNIHHCTNSCKKYGEFCRYGFPRLFTNKTIISNPLPNEMNEDEKKLMLEKRKLILTQVKDGYKKLEEEKNDQKYDQNPGKFLLKICQIDPKQHFILNPIDYDIENEDAAAAAALQIYEQALSYSEKGRSIFLKRKISERNVNNYNPLFHSVWQANTDIQIALDTHAVVSYITDYMTKSDQGLTNHLKAALNEKKNASKFEQLNHVKKVYFLNKQTSVCEAAFRLIPGLNLKDSNIKTLFVQSGFPENRQTYIHQLDEDAGQKKGFEVEGREGRFQQSKSKFDYYENRPCDTDSKLSKGVIEEICYAEFCMNYEWKGLKKPKKPKNVQFDDFGIGFLEKGSASNSDLSNEGKKYPKYIRLQAGKGYMYLRSNPNILRIYSGKRNDVLEESYSEMVLFTSWRDERKTFWNDDPKFRECIQEMFKKKDDTCEVKLLLFNFFDNVFNYSLIF